MNGVAAVRAVLAAGAQLLALLPDEDSVFAGPAPIGTTLPFVMLGSISTADLNVPSPGETRFVIERVQVTCVGRNYPEQKALVHAVRRAAADQLNVSVEGITGVTIHTDTAGPEFYDEEYAGWRRSQDLKVKYTEQR